MITHVAENQNADMGHCQICGKHFALQYGFIVQHEHPISPSRLCPGSGRIPIDGKIGASPMDNHLNLS